MTQYAHKVAVVTGAGSGIGRSLALALGRAGARVIVTDIDQAAADAVAREVGGSAEAHRVDVTDRQAVAGLAERIVADHGRVDYLFSNAGVAAVGEVRHTPLEEWRRVLDVNLWGTLHCIDAFYPIMVAQKSGHIAITASIVGLALDPRIPVYALTKHALIALALSLRAEAAGLGVRVSAICPGYVQSNLLAAAHYFRLRHDALVAAIPIKPSDPDVVAAAALRGVARNQALIIAPFSARVLWWLNRLAPGLKGSLDLAAMKQLRAFQVEPEERDVPVAAGAHD